MQDGNRSRAILCGVPLPPAKWREGVDHHDTLALLSGGAHERIARLLPEWQPLHEGDIVTAVYPQAQWRFTRGH